MTFDDLFISRALSRRSVLVQAGAAGAALLLGAGGARAASGVSGATPQTGGTLIAVLDPEPAGLIAGITISAPAVAVSSNLFDGLVEYDETFKPRPSLATSWETAPDGTAITFHLREGVTWHDGAPFTSADVQYSLMEVTKKTHPRGNAVFANLVAVETPDPLTAVLRFARPSPVVWAAFNGTETQILPKHLYEGTNPLANPWNVKPVGTGAFVFKEWIKGDRIVLERNPNYWDKGRPSLDRVVFRIIRDAASRAAALETGEAQYIPLNPVPLSDVQRLKSSKDLVVETRGFEGPAPMYFFDFNLRREPFGDIRVRQAFAHALNRQALADTVFYGLAKPATGPVPSYQAQFYTPDVPQYDFNIAKAEALLDAAGLKKGADGVRLRIDHVPAAYGEDYRRAGEFFRQALKRIGVEVTLRNFDLPTYVKIIFTEYDFDTHSAWYSAYPDPQIGVQRRFWSQAIKKGTPSSNASGVADPEIDAVIERIQTEGDVGKRNAQVRELQRLAQVKLPSITLLELTFFRVYSSRLSGIDFSPFGGYQSLKSVQVGS
ncbi:ABC transporter substrate-binding protein [Xanthobacter autotrophicus]|jgi:peptide/nickel transport system substrate-binding protein|uniref:ABC transporter substrate-binding protein n=1 Tax=Xanthobacter autotrophicus TaxID=280 RepID=UPI00372C047F